MKLTVAQEKLLKRISDHGPKAGLLVTGPDLRVARNLQKRELAVIKPKGSPWGSGYAEYVVLTKKGIKTHERLAQKSQARTSNKPSKRPKWWDLALLVRASFQTMSESDKDLFKAVAFEEPDNG